MGASMTDPLIGLYHSSKAAVRNLSLTLDNEVKPFGIKTCLIEPGYFRTNLLSSGTSFQLPETKIEAYAEINEKTKTFLTERDRKQSGDPKRGAQVIFDVLTSSGCARGREVPKTLALGSDAVKCIIGSNEEFNKRVEEWKSVSESTDFPKEEQHY
jgi:NAD(P)-dependent dehydrogenase (short-subunit alcohol dehydrogenase family)